MSNLGYISIIFNDETKKRFKKLTNAICTLDDYYYSDVVDYIKGDVTDKLHLTLFYGFIDEKVDKNKIEKEVLNVKKYLTYVNATNIALKYGYKNLYKILFVEIEKSKELKHANEIFKKFPYDKSVQLEFKPHLALAYVKPDFDLKGAFELDDKLDILDVRYEV